ncbi:hypothetical protein MVEN_00607200 [Mycena venus]|uniref:Uncharacterized protein n=1 Tax=Mycena venus TaxID=2733690 RepID=A0A8H6YRF2_9AGAR|nr:hypothetical protein MVEN_00607200 [Mycena venus]
MDYVEPKLPPEMERVIFEIAALSRPVTIPKLMLVARRVCSWVEPLLYRVICVSDSQPIDGFPHFTMDILEKALEAKQASFFQDAVRHVFVGFTDFCPPFFFRQIESFMTACAGITTLCIADRYLPSFHMLNHLNVMPLQHLMVNLDAIFDGGLYFSSPAFHDVTHLYILGSLVVASLNIWGTYETTNTSAKDWEMGLTSIPHLTHFAFNRPRFRNIVYPALHECPRLQCCILLCTLGHGVDGTKWLPESRDIRFVVDDLPDAQADWLSGVVGGQDMWARAEAVISARRAEQMRAEKL